MFTENGAHLVCGIGSRKVHVICDRRQNARWQSTRLRDRPFRARRWGIEQSKTCGTFEASQRWRCKQAGFPIEASALELRHLLSVSKHFRTDWRTDVQSRILAETNGRRTYALVLETGDEVMSSLQDFADREQLSAAGFSAIGAFSDAVLTYFDWEKKDYIENPVEEQVEVASLNGDIALAPDGSRALHIHTVLGRRDGTALAGHLAEAHVRPTLELVLTENPEHLRKRYDPDSGLVLIRPES